ncbi:membrane protein insertion efficiency factor YidD [Gluconacetobacter entanii]|uniref:Putative membrane protein insertion efficiency factor n=1 Tax=Gluconacetobacter entanii TaxID=108528 RepID=A0A318PZY1_9PROT|nr:membrane protein insertion efficiency factor YidD [Gluconacetobacter entanii]MBE7620107.1 membrane protein insertion efficiency factor YidD [Komagataeibacter sp. FXV2]MCE2579879.1 membrane protein insertion efficiency factor YidD [Komagataeibacter sp. FNDCR1]MBY4639405.1 membrane protein insertion efficiency factor YidD [Gluconacetobacter entanii]MCW4582083.1 membrane protein insertion efficiency factor YidD [Gluconacetobacter entanii]MCW4585558.1 membrane protein insertion efficiency facto
MRAMIRAYQLLVRPVIGANCRFTPSCSHYARDALARHGAWRGGLMSLWRIMRCNPWNAGGYDPVPDTHHDGRSCCCIHKPE